MHQYIMVQGVHNLRPKKIPVVPVSYREKIRVGRSEIFFLIFFYGFGRFFAGRFAVESRHQY
jgi:hypothetical protein